MTDIIFFIQTSTSRGINSWTDMIDIYKNLVNIVRKKIDQILDTLHWWLKCISRRDWELIQRRSLQKKEKNIRSERNHKSLILSVLPKSDISVSIVNERDWYFIWSLTLSSSNIIHSHVFFLTIFLWVRMKSYLEGILSSSSFNFFPRYVQWWLLNHCEARHFSPFFFPYLIFRLDIDTSTSSYENHILTQYLSTTVDTIIHIPHSEYECVISLVFFFLLRFTRRNEEISVISESFLSRLRVPY